MTKGKWRWELKYDPSQPREPKGTPEGGQWTKIGGVGSVKDVDISGRLYEVDVSKKPYAAITRFELRETAYGPMAQALAELTGKPVLVRTYFVVDSQEYKDVVRALGWNFGRSRVWRDTWEDFVGMEERQQRRRKRSE